MALILALVYYLFPNMKQPFRLTTPGTLIAMVGWVAASLGFSFYVQNFGSCTEFGWSLAHYRRWGRRRLSRWTGSSAVHRRDYSIRNRSLFKPIPYYSATHGALAAVIVLLFYFYISAAVLFGAEVNSEIYREVAEGEEETGTVPGRPDAS